MKNNRHLFRFIPLALFLMTLSVACKKEFLEITPKGKLIAQSVTDYDQLLNNTNLLNTGANAQTFLADDVAGVEPFFSSSEIRTQRLFTWQDVIYEADEDANETAAMMRNIYVFNKIINEVPQAIDGTEAEKKSIQAEALAGRAWTYFQLINYFGKPYQSRTAETDMGFPIVKVSDVTEVNFSRASVQQVYDFILDDLITAIPNLPQQTYHRFRMSKGAAEILLGKVYMFMGNFEAALPYLNNAFTSLSSASVPVHLIDYNLAFEPGGLFMPPSPFGPSTPTIGNDPETIYAKQFSNFWITTSELVITPETIDLFGATDQRLNFYSNTPFPTGQPYPAGLLRRTGPLTTSYGVVLADLYLLRAECKARLNDLSGAVDDVKTLRENRMPLADADVPFAIASDKMPLLRFIIDERKREFAAQGVRWFDMRRLSVDPLLPPVTYTHSIYDASGSPTTYTLKPERLVLRIPAKILNENPGMKDNL